MKFMRRCALAALYHCVDTSSGEGPQEVVPKVNSDVGPLVKPIKLITTVIGDPIPANQGTKCCSIKLKLEAHSG